MRNIRISIAVIATFLISLGITMIYSSSGIYALGELGDKTYFVHRHLLFLCIGLLASFAILAFDYRELRTIAKPLMLLIFIMLVLVLIPGIGKASFGARRWFKIGAFHFQPSEFAGAYILSILQQKQQKCQQHT